MNVQEIFKSFEQIKVAVIGDAMLDTYWWGDVERISPEAPVPIVKIDHREYRLGGAANVALNLKSLGAQVYMMSVIGDDEDGVLLEKLIHDNGINTNGIYKSDKRITTNKIRIIGRNQQMMRLDREMQNELDGITENIYLQKLYEQLKKEQPQLLIFEDYNKGMLTEQLISKVISYCKELNIITAVDPKNNNFFSYKGVDIFKPNLKEARESLGIPQKNIDANSLQLMHTKLFEKLNHRISLITLSDKGIFYENEQGHEIIPAHIRNIADVSGAGDTVIAVASLVYTATKNEKLMAEMSNLAGGLVCEEVGTVAINKEKLMKECELLLK